MATLRVHTITGALKTGISVMPNKSLGQHWLKDPLVLAEIAELAALKPTDTVLEIGPGLGTLTSRLLARAGKVIAVEFDGELARKLPKQFPGKNLEVIEEDILSFDLDTLPENYKVVANIPYYITSKIVRKLLEADNKPSLAVLLIQKEVAERLAAHAGDMSILAVSAQVYAEVSLGPIVPAKLFMPPPQVDSQVVILKTRAVPLVLGAEEKAFYRVVKAGFSARRKKLRSSLSGGLRLSKSDTEQLLQRVNISPDARAEDLSIADWRRLMEVTYDTP